MIYFNFASFYNGFVLGIGVVGVAGLFALFFKSARALFDMIAS